MTQEKEISQGAAIAAVDTSAEAVGRSIVELMSWLTGPDSGQNDGLVVAANQLAALIAERDGKAQEAWQALDMWKRAASERDAARAQAKQAQTVLARWQHYGCPDCGGDCGSANPPVTYCLMRQTCDALAERGA